MNIHIGLFRLRSPAGGRRLKTGRRLDVWTGKDAASGYPAAIQLSIF